MDFGKKLKLACHEANIGLTELANKISVSPGSISRWINGSVKNISIAYLSDIAKHTNKPVEFFTDDSYYLNEISQKGFSVWFKETKKKLRISVANISTEAKIPEQIIAEFLNGTAKPTIDQLDDLCFALKADMDEIMAAAGYLPTGPETIVCEPKATYGTSSQVPTINWTQANSFNVASLDAIKESSISACITGKDFFALKVDTDDMSPKFQDPVYIIINPNADIVSGDYVVVADQESERALLRQYKILGDNIILHPLNPKYDDVLLTNSQRPTIIGKVVAKQELF